MCTESLLQLVNFKFQRGGGLGGEAELELEAIERAGGRTERKSRARGQTTPNEKDKITARQASASLDLSSSRVCVTKDRMGLARAPCGRGMG
jgi:hypothetical protein